MQRKNWVKKGAFCLFVVFLFHYITGCTPKPFTVDETEKNIVSFEGEIKEVVENYGYEIIIKESFEEGKSIVDIHINTEEKIEIEIVNSAINSGEKGVERFYVDYIREEPEELNQFNLELFVKLLECLSQKTVTVEFCRDFLEAPEEDYAATDYGYQKVEGDLIAKQYSLNWEEDWILTYNLTSDEVEILGFGGTTKNGY